MNWDTMSGFERDKMILEKTGGSAFPVHGQYGNKGEGMDLRDWLAGQALVGICANSLFAHSGHGYEYLAEWAYSIADALMAKRRDFTHGKT